MVRNERMGGWRGPAPLILILFCLFPAGGPSLAFPQAVEESGTDTAIQEGLPQWEGAFGGEAFLHYSLASGLWDLCPAWGLSFADADRDGFVDLFVTNHLHFPSRLFRNRGDGTFENVTEGSGIKEWLDDHDAAWGDMDNDGLPELATTNGYYRPDHLFRNLGGMKFEEISGAAGYTMGTSGRGRNCAFMDFDLDGYLDLFTSNLRGSCYLYWNTGQGRFMADTHRARLDSAFRHAAASVGDLDGDGLADIVLGGGAKQQPTQFFHNFGNRLFSERGLSAGITRKDPVGAVVLGDYDNDGKLDLFLGADGAGAPTLYRNLGGGAFEDATEAAGLGGASGRSVCGTFFDFDNDGDLDLYVVNTGGRFDLNEANLFYENIGNGRFRDITKETGLEAASPGNGASIAVADVDGDGRLDFVLANGKNAVFPMGPILLFLNRTKGGGFIRFELEGRASNRDALGAEVRLRTRAGIQVRQAGLRNAYAQNEKTLHFGTGEETMVERVVIRWPSGVIQVLRDLPVNRMYRVVEPETHRWFGDLPEALALRRGPSKASMSLVARSGGDLDGGLAERVSALKSAWRPLIERSVEMVRRLQAEPVTEEEVRAYYERHRDRYTIPRVVWVEQAAIGPFSRDAALLHDGAALQEEEIARQSEFAAEVRGHLEEGKDLFALALGFRILSWKMPYADLEMFHGYISAGYYTESMLRERFLDDIAEEIWEAGPGEVLGPYLAREGLDVQDPGEANPLSRVFRVLGEKRPPLIVPYGTVSPVIRRYLEHQRSGKIEESMEGGQEEAAPLSPQLEEALETEALAQAMAERIMADREPTRKEVEDYYRENASDFTLEAALFGQCLSIRGEREVREFARRLEKGQHFNRIIQEMKVPELTSRSARSNEIYRYRTTLTRSRVEGITGRDVFDELWGMEAGTLAGPYEHFGRTHYLFITDKLEAMPIPFHQVERFIKRGSGLAF